MLIKTNLSLATLSFSLVISGLLPTQSFALDCDANADSVVDRRDIKLIASNRRTPVPISTNRLDVDGDGVVGVRDARKCVAMCTERGCAVAQPNLDPTITSTPSTFVLATLSYTYDVEASDPEGDPLNFKLLISPEGVEINPATGFVQWTPGLDQIGNHEIQVAVEDSRGGGVTQTYQVSVETPAQVPDLRGFSVRAAEQEVLNAQLSIGEVAGFPDAEVPVDTVISQAPVAGTVVRQESIVDIAFSTGPISADTMLLNGPDSALAVDSTINFLGPTPVEPEDILQLSDDRAAIYRDVLRVRLSPSTTVGELNSLFRRQGIRIIAMRESLDWLTVSFQSSGDDEQVQDMIDALEADSSIAFAMPVLVEDIFSLGSSPLLAEVNASHLLAMGFPAAWNAAGSSHLPTSLHILDRFGQGPPSDTLFNLTHAKSSDYASLDRLQSYRPRCQPGRVINRTIEHGYHVLGLATASKNGLGVVGGAAFNSPPVSVAACDYYKAAKAPFMCLTLNMSVDDSLVKVVNISSGFNVCPSELPVTDIKSPYNDSMARSSLLNLVSASFGKDFYTEKVDYITKILEPFSSNTVFVTAAGNSSRNLNGTAVRASAFASPIQLAIARLPTNFVVENRHQTLRSYFDPNPAGVPSNLIEVGMLSERSSVGGNISAIGTGISGAQSELPGVVSYLGPNGPVGRMSGTSQAAPTVAGGLLYLASLTQNEGKSAAQIASLVDRSTMRLFDGGIPAMDIYAAVLLSDEGELGDSMSFASSVRMEILDVATEGLNFESEINSDATSPDQVFGLADIRRFLSEFQNRNGDRDYSRFDLNGNGLTGGIRLNNDGPSSEDFSIDKDRFDLNADGEYTSITFDMEGVSVSYDENLVSDHEVLCYYAYSPTAFNAGNISDDLARERALVLLPIMRECGLRLSSLVFQSGLDTGDSNFFLWNVSPAEISLSGVFDRTYVDQSIPFLPRPAFDECGSGEQGAAGGSLFSSLVEIGSMIFQFNFADGAAVFRERLGFFGLVNKLTSCSSMLAVKDGKMWLNYASHASGLDSSGFFGLATTPFNEEFQIRRVSFPNYESSSDGSQRTSTLDVGIAKPIGESGASPSQLTNPRSLGGGQFDFELFFQPFEGFIPRPPL